MQPFVIWKDLPIIVKLKIIHITKIGGKLYNSFILDWGDIPIVTIKTDGTTEEVVNNRGKAYATRNRQCFRKRYNRQKEKLIR